MAELNVGDRICMTEESIQVQKQWAKEYAAAHEAFTAAGYWMAKMRASFGQEMERVHPELEGHEFKVALDTGWIIITR